MNADLLPALMSVIAGILVILCRNPFAQFATGLLQGTSISENANAKVERFLSVGMGAFGGVFILIGVGIGASKLGLI